MLQIENVAGPESRTLCVAGDLTGSAVSRLERSWNVASSSGAIRVDLCGLKSVDCQGQELLKRMFSEGAEFAVGPHGPLFSRN